MIKEKLYSRLNQPDQAALLPTLIGHEPRSNFTRAREKDRAKKKSRGHVEIEADLCKGCLLCLEVCAPEVLAVSTSLNRMGYHPVEYKGERCTGCGVCYYVCPEPGSIRVYKRIAS